MTATDFSDDTPLVESKPRGLTFGDGFQFGCGFFVAGMIASVMLALLALLIVTLLSLMGVGLFGDFLGAAGPLVTLI